jgi:probable HAF family extracellular repeat protein
MLDLPTRTIQTQSAPENAGTKQLGINNKGEVTGAALLANPAPFHAFLYDSKTMIDLGTLGGRDSVGEAINAKGHVTGNSDTTIQNGFSRQNAFLYNGTKMIDLGTLGGLSSTGYAINNSDEVVGTSTTANGRSDAFLYSKGTMFDLNSLISRTDPLHDAIWLGEATGINNRGQIVADGYYTSGPLSGESHAFLLNPAPLQGTPLPPAWTMMLTGLGALGLLGWRRKQKAASAADSSIENSVVCIG